MSENGAFLAFWSAYPKHEAKIVAKKSFMIHVSRPGIPLEVVLAGIERHRQGRKWQEGIIPMPATWINQHRWEDEVEPWNGGRFTPKTAGNAVAMESAMQRVADHDGQER